MRRPKGYNFGISFVDNKNNSVSIDDILEDLDRKLSNNNLVAWVAIGIAVALTIPILIAQGAEQDIREQKDIIKEYIEEHTEEQEDLKERIIRLEEAIKLLR